MKTRKTSGEVVELVMCANNMWSKWIDLWFYVKMDDGIGDVQTVPSNEMVMHRFVAFL